MDNSKDVFSEDKYGLWGSDTVELHKVASMDFKTFFTAYDSFKAIRDADVSVQTSFSLINGFLTDRHSSPNFEVQQLML